VNAEFWVRRGTALDIQRARPEAEACFRRACELAPKSAPTWYAYALHLQAFPNRWDEARKALDTCLALDPYFPPADILRRQLVPSR
jgi:tetratricopeptide (TPR) repeat protein